VLADFVGDTAPAEVLATPVAEALLLVACSRDHVGDHEGVEGLVRTGRDRDVLDQRAGLQVDLQAVGREVLTAASDLSRDTSLVTCGG
jgi:hypothetical protein